MKVLHARGLDKNRLNYTPAFGEIIVTSDTKKMYIGDGVTPGGNDLSIDSNIKMNRDPRIDENIPGLAIGTLWVNIVSGEMFTLTRNTTDDNRWVSSTGRVIDGKTYSAITTLTEFKTLIPLDEIDENGKIKDHTGFVIGSTQGMLAEYIEGVGNTKSIYFGGAQHIVMNDDPVFNFADQAHKKTVCIWIYPTVLPAGNNKAYILNRGVNNEDINLTLDDDGKISLISGESVLTSSNTVNVNSWNFISFMKTDIVQIDEAKSVCDFELYVNNTVTQGNSIEVTSASEETFRIGSLDGTQGFTGYMSHFAIFNEVLTNAEMIQFKNSIISYKGLL